MSTTASKITSLTIVYSTFYSGVDQRKHRISASLAFVWGIHRWPVNSPHKWPVTRKMFPFDDVIMVEYANLMRRRSVMISPTYPLYVAGRNMVPSNKETGIILSIRSANEKRLHNVTSSLIGWAHTENDLRGNSNTDKHRDATYGPKCSHIIGTKLSDTFKVLQFQCLFGAVRGNVHSVIYLLVLWWPRKQLATLAHGYIISNVKWTHSCTWNYAVGFELHSQRSFELQCLINNNIINSTL